jgi:hypothetical protein
MFSIGTITIPTHTKHVPKSVHIPNIVIVGLVPKQLVKPIGVLAIKLVIPPYTIKQHLLENFFHPKVGEMIVDEAPTQEQVHDLTIVGWIVTKEEQLTKVNLGTKENVQQMKVYFTLESVVIDQLIKLLKEFKNVFA